MSATLISIIIDLLLQTKHSSSSSSSSIEKQASENKVQLMEDHVFHSGSILLREVETIDDSPIEQVRLTVPITDDPTIPCLTFRTWSLGLTSCVLLSTLNQFFAYRRFPVSIEPICIQIIVLPIAKFMAKVLPTTPIRVPMTRWTFSLNPGPFNIKEHVLIAIFANSGANSVFAVSIIVVVKAFYHSSISPIGAMLLCLTTQMFGYGWAGMFRKYLVDSPYMWWPSVLVQVPMFRAMHEKEVRPKGGLKSLQFLFIVVAISFAYYIFPGYFFPSLSAVSVVCLIWRDSVTAQQIGSGLHGLGVGSFSLDWSAICGYLGNPLATPGFAILNIFVGFALTMYVLVPIAYMTNTYEAKRFPIFSSDVFEASGAKYDISRVLNKTTFQFEEAGYDAYGKIHLSIYYVFMIGLGFATLAATVSHVALFDGRTIWGMWTQSDHGAGDVHTRLMKKNYESVPQWWFHIILSLMVALALLGCGQFQLPYWAVLLACVLPLIFTVPLGVVLASTNQQIQLDTLSQLVGGYLLSGKPLGSLAFRTYSTVSQAQALGLLQDFKLGHYMKIPPKSMFVVQLVGSAVASFVYFGMTWWLLTTVDHICEPSNLPLNTAWSCPSEGVMYSMSIVWGTVGPIRVFGRLGLYSAMYWFFLIGFLAPVPVWVLSTMYPGKKWIKLINMPNIFGATQFLPPAGAVNYWSFLGVGAFFNLYVYRRFKSWWAKHTYILSAGLYAGISFMVLFLYFSLQMVNHISGVGWWVTNSDDGCPLASCPTAPGIMVEGCPAHH